MKLRDQYDWIVLGDHPAALLTASLVTKLGLSALVLPFFPNHRFFVSKSGQYFDPEGRSIIGLSGGEKSAAPVGLLQESLRRLGAQPSELDAVKSEGRSPQVITPETRLVLPPDESSFFEELRRELGGDALREIGIAGALKEAGEEIRQYWLKLPERLTLDPAKKKAPRAPFRVRNLLRKLASQSRNRDRATARWFVEDQRISDLPPSLVVSTESSGDALGQMCAGLWFAVTSALHEDPELPDFLHMLALGKTVASYQGGMSAYRDLLLRLAKRLGADIPPQAECRSLFVESGRLQGVQISHHANMIGCGAAILGCSLGQINDRVSVSGNQWFRKLKPAPQPAGWRFTLALTVHAEAIPTGMSAHAVWKERGAPVLDIEIVEPGEFGQAEPDRRIIFARTVMPFTAESLNEDYQRMIAARVFRQLTEILPFLEFHVTRIFPDFRADLRAPEELEASRSEFREAFPFSELQNVPENLRIYSSAPGQGLGSRSGVEGLFVATGESFPELGTLGPTVAALEAVAWLAHRSGLPGPFV